MNTLDFSSLRILVIGDVMLDHYLYGQIHRISPEAPVPIVDIEYEESRLGGAANVMLNLAGLGAKATLLSVIGDDKNAHTFFELLKKHQLKTNAIITSASRITTVKTRIFDDDRQVVRFDKEDDADISHDLELELIERFNDLVKKEKFHAIIVQDYNKGVLTKKVIKHILLQSTKMNIPVAVDPKEYNFFEYQQIDLFKPNIKELAEALQIKIDPKNINSLRKAAEELKRKNRFDNLMLTLGAHGIFVYTQQGDSFIVPARPIKTADVSGAGDTVISIATLCFVKEMPFKKMAQLANAAAGKVCKKVGVSPITLKELKA
ncbi:MAG: bifunctional ADP-heptose synthase [Chitinophagales bacterium]